MRAGTCSMASWRMASGASTVVHRSVPDCWTRAWRTYRKRLGKRPKATPASATSPATGCSTSCARQWTGEPLSSRQMGTTRCIAPCTTRFPEVPLKHHLRAKLIDGHELNRAVAEQLAACDSVDRRQLFERAKSELDEHRSVLQAVIDCENLLAVVEGNFLLAVLLQGRNAWGRRGFAPAGPGPDRSGARVIRGFWLVRRADGIVEANQNPPEPRHFGRHAARQFRNRVA